MHTSTKKWLFIKVSSFILIPFILWFIINFVSIIDNNYYEVVNFFKSQPSKVLFSVFLVFSFFFYSLTISEIFEDYINKLNESNSFSSKIVTSLEKKSHFYDAEEYHHNYFEKNPLNGYCNMVVRPKVEKFRNENK